MTKRRLLVGADPFPPYQYLDANGNLCGGDYERVRDAFARAGYDIDVRLDDWPKVEEDVRGGVLDAAFQVQRTPSRESLYQFSDLLRNAVTEVVTTRAELCGLASYSEVAARGLKVAVSDGYFYGNGIDGLPPSARRAYADQAALLRAVHSGEADLGVIDKGVKTWLMLTERIAALPIVERLTFKRPLHVIFVNASLRDEFDAGLRAERLERSVS